MACQSDKDIRGYAVACAQAYQQQLGGEATVSRVGVTLKIPDIWTELDAGQAEYAMRCLSGYRKLNAPFKQTKKAVTLLFPDVVKRRERQARREAIA